MPTRQPNLAEQIRKSERSHEAVDTSLSTDQRVLARITDGIYRQPASALRELISNAYDADAQEVIITTDAPRFGEISVRDDGLGLSPEVLEHLIKHIGSSAKHSKEGVELGVTERDDPNRSPSGRQFIGKLGIGLFSVAQFTRHFLIITKVKGEKFRTVADITLGAVGGQQPLLPFNEKKTQEIETGHARIWREPASDVDSQGTEVKLLNLLPRTRAELASDDLWSKIDFEKTHDTDERTPPPRWHIGRMAAKQTEILTELPSLPWDNTDSEEERFKKFVTKVRESADTDSESVDLDILCDHYLQMLWTLALSAPLPYIDVHPFDLSVDDEVLFFQISGAANGQAKPLELKPHEHLRDKLNLQTPNGAPNLPFRIIVDGIQLFRPILYRGLPKTKSAIKTPLLFAARHRQEFGGKPLALSGGPLQFEAYLFWSPKIVPKQHQGVVLRVGNASGSLFDRTFMGYQTSEQTRTRQITAEIFVSEGLEDAINIDRESYNYAHPHYQYLVKWLHSAFRQLANRQKELGKKQRTEILSQRGNAAREKLDEKVESALKARGVEDVPDVVLAPSSSNEDARKQRTEGKIVLQKSVVLPPSTAQRRTTAGAEAQKLAERKAVAITQLLDGWGLLQNLTYAEQEQLVRDIIEIVLIES